MDSTGQLTRLQNRLGNRSAPLPTRADCLVPPARSQPEASRSLARILQRLLRSEGSSRCIVAGSGRRKGLTRAIDVVGRSPSADVFAGEGPWCRSQKARRSRSGWGRHSSAYELLRGDGPRMNDQPDRLRQVLEAIDAANAKDPHLVEEEGRRFRPNGSMDSAWAPRSPTSSPKPRRR